MFFRIYLVKNADRIRSTDNIVVQEYIDKVTMSLLKRIGNY